MNTKVVPSFPAWIIKICLIPTYVSIAMSWLLANQRAGLKAIVTGSDASVFDHPVLHFNELRLLKLAQLETSITRAFDNIPYIGRLEVTELVQHFTHKYKNKKLPWSLGL